ncbi:MAG: hypothetical protein S4CHLAM102_12750 [Chlamydiia bacterium]|nr:hypothetical protein [Chlamydiia bacterium]
MENQPEIQNKLSQKRRLFAGIFDYLWLASALTFGICSLTFEYTVPLLLGAMLLLPVISAFVESILIRVFSTTPGKFIFGIQVQNETGGMPSFRQIFKKSMLKGWRLQILFLPIINVIALPFLIKRYQKNQSPSWDSIDYPELVERKNTRFNQVITLFLIGVFAFLQFEAVSTTFNRHLFAPKAYEMGTDLTPEILGWRSYELDEGSFSASFPNKPEYVAKDFPIPSSTEKLPFYEYSHEHPKEPIRYSISYTVLPDGWMKWSSGLILKGAMKIIVRYTSGSKLVDKQKISSKKYPGYNYTLSKSGTLIKAQVYLIGNRLYRVETQFAKDLDTAEQKKADVFIQSFKPA